MSRANYTRLILSAVALAAAVIHSQYPNTIDLIAAGFILLAIVPWLYPVIKSIEIPGIGKLELQVDAVEKQQKILKNEVDSLRFLISGFVTDWELIHLKRLSQPGPVTYVRGVDKGDRFTAEIIRLRDLGLISKRVTHSLWDMALKGDLCDYVEITERGREYLKLRSQYNA